MQNLPKVSVMVVTYNQAHLIRETLDSILNDNYENFNIVVSDDASTDGSQQILQEYKNKYPDKFKLILNSVNLGITANCNKALSACDGDYIALFAGDDLFLPGKLKAQVNAFLNNPQATLSYHAVEIFDSATGKTLYVTHQRPSEDIKNAYDIIKNIGVSACSVMIKRSACPHEGFNQRLPIVSDWLLQIEVALKGSVIKVNQILARYRKHSQGTTHNVHKLFNETMQVLELLIEKYPNDQQLISSCKLGKARYMIGEAYRQLANDIDLSCQLAREAKQLNPASWRYRIFYYVCRFFVTVKPAARIFMPMLIRMKYIIKKNFS